MESARRSALRGRSRIHGFGYDLGSSRFAASLNPSEQSLKRTKAIALGFVQFRGKRGAMRQGGNGTAKGKIREEFKPVKM